MAEVVPSVVKRAVFEANASHDHLGELGKRKSQIFFKLEMAKNRTAHVAIITFPASNTTAPLHFQTVTRQ